MYFFYFYPLGLDCACKRRPVLSWLLMAVMTGAFLWIRYWPDRGPMDPWDLVFYPGNGRPVTVLTAAFMHAGWLHLIGNLLYLHVFGPPLEDRLGPGRFLLYFLVLGTFGNLAHGLVSAMGWLGQGGVGVMGASGSIAGLLAMSLVRLTGFRVQVAWWILAPLAGQNRAGKSRVPLSAAVGFWLMLQVVQTMVAAETGASVSFGAHLGGFAMGLVLALMMGEAKAGRVEASRMQAARYFRNGQFHAAAGAWTEYLEKAPQDLRAWLELARVQQLSKQPDQSLANFRKVYQVLMDAQKADEALRVFDEAERFFGHRFLDPDELGRVAYFKEKQLDFAGALHVYRQLYENHPQHPQGQRALVRVIMLYHGKVGDPTAARHWLQEAWEKLQPGTWRDFLEQEFKLESVSGRVAPPAAAPDPR